MFKESDKVKTIRLYGYDKKADNITEKQTKFPSLQPTPHKHPVLLPTMLNHCFLSFLNLVFILFY